MAWINTTNYWTGRDDTPLKKRRTEEYARKAARKKARPPVCAVNEMTNDKQHRAPRIDAKTLHPYTGALACRLHQHISPFPVCSHSKLPPKCALHRWATGGEVFRSHVFECDQCKVCLCLIASRYSIPNQTLWASKATSRRSIWKPQKESAAVEGNRD
jgi:hypothetical protein